MTSRLSASSSAYFLLVLTSLLWAGNFVVARAIHASIPPMTLSFARWVIALLVLLPLGLRPAVRQFHLYRPYWRRILLLSLLGITAFNSLVYWGLQFTSATNGVLLNSFIPILIALFGALFFRMPMNWKQGGAILISFFGVLTIVAHGDAQRLLALDINRGDAIVFSAMVAWAFYTLLLRGLPGGVDRLGLLTVQVALGLLGILPFFVWEVAHVPPLHLDLPGWAACLYVGTLPSVAAYYCYNLGVARVGAARAGSFIHLMPAFGAVLSMLFLGEAIHAYHLFGIGAILAGVWLATRVGR
ncbi:MAG TPA: DMT family transporter [Chromobacteriaceae bacterium]|nr:DMT family transporter [Chromobacteriaceae bacterium]